MNNSRLIAQLGQQIPVFSAFIDALRASGLTSWLVGGCVRDLLLGRECADIDIVSSEDPSDWARSWAQGRGYWFWLDEQRRQSRILLNDGVSLDFAPLRAATIAGDLKARDFTINAIAIPINEADLLFDPLSGVADLHNQRLKMCSADSFRDDPLRILKGIRHAAVLHFSIDDPTIAAMTQQAQQLKEVAMERIREELLKILVVRDIAYALQVLSQSTVLQVLLGPSTESWSEERYAATHQTHFDRFSAFCEQHQPAVSMDFQQHHSIFHLAALLMTYAPQRFSQIYAELRLSRSQQRLLNALREDLPVAWREQLRQLSSDRQRSLAVDQLKPCGPERVLYHGWCREQLDDDLVVSLLAAYQQQQENGRIPDLINGHAMMHYTNTDNRAIGELLQQVKVREINGEIRTKEDALKWLRGHLGFDKN